MVSLYRSNANSAARRGVFQCAHARFLAALLISLAGFAPPAGAEDAAAAKTHTVKRGSLKVTVELDGVFEATNMHPIAFAPAEWNDLLVKQAVAHGAVVRQGDLLVSVDVESIDRKLHDAALALEQSEAAVQQAELELAILQQSQPLELEAAQRANRTSQEELDYFLRVDRAQSIKSAHRSVQRSEQFLEYAEEELKQLEKMYKEDDLTEETEEIILKRSRQDVENAKYNVETARVSRDRKLKFELPRQELQLKHQAAADELGLEKAKHSLPLSEQAARLKLEQARLEREKQGRALEDLRRDREAMQIRSPADGVVYYGACTDGKWPAASTAGAKLRPGAKITGPRSGDDRRRAAADGASRRVGREAVAPGQTRPYRQGDAGGLSADETYRDH